ncbi:MAG TPA: transglutaminaseTgpA domain-containing protein [Gaiellaceae bacterium]
MARGLRIQFGTIVGYLVGAILLTLAWSRLDKNGLPAGDVVFMFLCGLAPTVAVAYGVGRLRVALVVAIAAIAAAAAAFGISPTEARPGSAHDFFGPVFGGVRDGFQSFYESDLPFDPLDYPDMEGLVLLAIFGFAAVIGPLLATRRTLGASLVLLVGLGWPATLSPSDRPLLEGALVLAGILVFLVLARVELQSWRSVTPAIVAAAVLVLAAVGASTSQAVAKGAFLNWQAWDFYDPPDDPVSVSYVWAARYTGIDFPAKRTTVLKIKEDGPRRALYWRATTLDEYNGTSWNETSSLSGTKPASDEIDVATGDPLLPPEAKDRNKWVKQEVSNEALRDNHLIGASQPVRWEPGTSLAYQRGPGGTIFLNGNLRQGQHYTVWSYAPRPTASQLNRAGTDYPKDMPERYFEPLQGLRVPRLGDPNQDAFMTQLFNAPPDAFTAENKPLYELAKRLTAKATTPYGAAAVLEAWFRNPSAGGFTYDQHPPQPSGIGFQAPLLDFVLRTRKGYCQHFAGAMALMLRFLGVPARVAAGFTSGRYDADSKTWTVTDRNAHAWVEVYFPGYGWLPFDPTPGRGTFDAPYSFAYTASTSFDDKARDWRNFAEQLGIPTLTRNGQSNQDVRTGREPGTASGARPDRRGGVAAPASGGGGRAVDTSLIAFVALVLACASVAILLAKTVRRRLRFTTKDPRRIAAACRADLVGFLRDQGVDPAPSATVSELGVFVETEFAVDAGPYVRSLSVARFGPPPEAPGAARSARRELGRLRREMWRQLTWGRRIRTALSLRSFAG